jgi:Double zinc ribbon
MFCPSCKHENRAGRRFCAHCGVKLTLVCASCKAENEPGEQFCGDCGQRIAEPAEARPPPEPRSYTPKHLAEKILTSRSALEGERKRIELRPPSAPIKYAQRTTRRPPGSSISAVTRRRRPRPVRRRAARRTHAPRLPQPPRARPPFRPQRRGRSLPQRPGLPPRKAPAPAGPRRQDPPAGEYVDVANNTFLGGDQD